MPFKMRTPSVRMLNVTLESDRCTVKVGKTQNTVRPGVWSSHGQSRKNTKYSVVGPVRRFDSSKLSRPSASSHCKGARGAAPRPFRYEEKRQECATISVALCFAFFLLPCDDQTSASKWGKVVLAAHFYDVSEVHFTFGIDSFVENFGRLFSAC